MCASYGEELHEEVDREALEQQLRDEVHVVNGRRLEDNRNARSDKQLDRISRRLAAA